MRAETAIFIRQDQPVIQDFGKLVCNFRSFRAIIIAEAAFSVACPDTYSDTNSA